MYKDIKCHIKVSLVCCEIINYILRQPLKYCLSWRLCNKHSVMCVLAAVICHTALIEIIFEQYVLIIPFSAHMLFASMSTLF